jgi:threonyl-tRNA synthetase
MKILFNHADSFSFEATKKAVNSAKDLSDSEKSGEAENSLVAFMAVEKHDEGKEEAVADRTIEEIDSVLEKIHADNVVVYPYAHLSSNLSSLDTAEKTLNLVYEKLKEKGVKVQKAPFGWYKAFKISGKGHPLAELSREIIIEEVEKKSKEDVSDAVKAEEKMKSSWAVLTLDGKMHPLNKEGNNIKGFDFKNYPNLLKFAQYEITKNRTVEKQPPHVELMRRHELVDYEPGSDPGNLRYYPKGRLIKGLLEDLVTKKVKEYGAMEIEAPIMYDFEHPSLKKYLNRFPARQYTIQTPNKKVFLRFAACFGQFLMAHDATISYKNLPMRLYEMTKYSFRVEKRGELTGLRRLRSFTMPDCHAFVSDFEMAKSEMKKRFDLADDILTKVGINRKEDLEMGVRLVKGFYNEHTEFVHELIKKWDKPVLVEMWDNQFFYFVMKYEWNFIDALDKASALTTDQIDVENAKTYGITYIDKDGSEKNPLIMHLSPSGAIERVIYALLERAYMRGQKGETAEFPLWLAPTQVRVIPITENNVKFAKKVQEELTQNEIRADIDERDLTLGKKIRESGQEWNPYTVVIGENEEKAKKLAVSVRGEKGQKTMEVKDLIKIISEKTKGMPYTSLPLAPELSKRPKFVG